MTAMTAGQSFQGLIQKNERRGG